MISQVISNTGSSSPFKIASIVNAVAIVLDFARPAFEQTSHMIELSEDKRHA